jgi:hypothetical protein
VYENKDLDDTYPGQAKLAVGRPFDKSANLRNFSQTDAAGADEEITRAMASDPDWGP